MFILGFRVKVRYLSSTLKFSDDIFQFGGLTVMELGHGTGKTTLRLCHFQFKERKEKIKGTLSLHDG